MDTMPMAWMPMCGQSWINAAASFVGMWTLMMAAMMLPSFLPTLWRYRPGRYRLAFDRGTMRLGVLAGLMTGGYFLVWALLGALVYPLEAALSAMSMRVPVQSFTAPIVAAMVMLAAGALQLTKWKARLLARCRADCREKSGACGRTLPGEAFEAWSHGLRLGLHCAQCCIGMTAVLLATGIMDLPAMAAVTGAITLERLAPAGERVARAIGVLMIGAGLFLALRAIRLVG